MMLLALALNVSALVSVAAAVVVIDVLSTLSALSARAVSVVIWVPSVVSAPSARLVSVVIAVLILARSPTRFVTCDSVMLPVIVVAVPFVISDKNAISCGAFV